jgi:predicted DNA-binding protein
MSSPQPSPAEELEQALGEVKETVTVKAQGKAVDVTVCPFRLREFANVLKCVQRMRAAGTIAPETIKRVKDAIAPETIEHVKDVENVENAEDASKRVTEAESAKEAKEGFDFVKMLLDGGDELINILSIAVGKQLQAQALNNLDLVDAARLASAVFAVNLDFFYQNKDLIQAALAPAVKAIESVATNGVEALGQPPLTDSSGQATD